MCVGVSVFVCQCVHRGRVGGFDARGLQRVDMI
jgi:hypothetical protein